MLPLDWNNLRYSCHNWTLLDMVSMWPKRVGGGAGCTTALFTEGAQMVWTQQQWEELRSCGGHGARTLGAPVQASAVFGRTDYVHRHCSLRQSCKWSPRVVLCNVPASWTFSPETFPGQLIIPPIQLAGPFPVSHHYFLFSPNF